MTDDPQGVGTETSAEVFERLFLPALAGPWASRVVREAQLGSGERVLDVACGTGAVTSQAAELVLPNGHVAGIDLSPEMLAVARRKLPGLDLREGRAEALPFDDDAFDVVTCQFALMFFDDRNAALGEMRRVLRTGGRVVVAVWDSLDSTPGYAALTELVERHLGAEAGAPIRASFALGDVEAMHRLLSDSGFGAVTAGSVDAPARFPSVRAWVEAEVRGWVGGEFGQEQYAALLDDADRTLAPYTLPDGSAEFSLPAIIAGGVNS